MSESPEILPPEAVDAEPSFPPPTIAKWLRSQAVNADDLADELWYWAVKMAGGDPSPLPNLLRASAEATATIERLERWVRAAEAVIEAATTLYGHAHDTYGNAVYVERADLRDLGKSIATYRAATYAEGIGEVP